MKTIRLKKDEDRRLRVGHLWIFSNEVDVQATPLAGIEPGRVVRVEDHRRHPVGLAQVNPAALICGRLLTRNVHREIDAAFVRSRLERALSLRDRLFPSPHYRLVHAEGDFLPGLVVDRHGDVLVVQSGTAGMDRLTPLILDALEGLLKPRGVLLKNDSPIRALEGLAEEVRVGLGEVPETVEIMEDGLSLVAPLAKGQKTGFYYDMRENRVRAASLVSALPAGSAVLDAFSYVGALGVRAAVNGAARVLCLDASKTALEFVQENARRNGVADRVEVLKADAMDALAGLPGGSFGLVSVDPPAFVKRKKDLGPGRQAYRKLNAMAAKLAGEGGFLLSASCSQHVSADDLRRTVGEAAREAKVWCQILWQGRQSQDHPVHPAMPETAYLKAVLCRLGRSA